MPLGKNVRYRFKRTDGAVRLAFKGNKAVEVKPYKRAKGGALKPSGSAKRIGR